MDPCSLLPLDQTLNTSLYFDLLDEYKTYSGLFIKTHEDLKNCKKNSHESTERTAAYGLQEFEKLKNTCACAYSSILQIKSKICRMEQEFKTHDYRLNWVADTLTQEVRSLSEIARHLALDVCIEAEDSSVMPVSIEVAFTNFLFDYKKASVGLPASEHYVRLTSRNQSIRYVTPHENFNRLDDYYADCLTRGGFSGLSYIKNCLFFGWNATVVFLIKSNAQLKVENPGLLDNLFGKGTDAAQFKLKQKQYLEEVYLKSVANLYHSNYGAIHMPSENQWSQYLEKAEGVAYDAKVIPIILFHRPYFSGEASSFQAEMSRLFPDHQTTPCHNIYFRRERTADAWKVDLVALKESCRTLDTQGLSFFEQRKLTLQELILVNAIEAASAKWVPDLIDMTEPAGESNSRDLLTFE
jgi:hypothetical protein